MSKLTVCKTCGAQIAKSAKACPQCGARRPSVRPVFAVLLTIVILFIVVGVIAALSDTPQKVSTPTDGNTPKAAAYQPPASTPEPVYTVGDTLELRKVQVTLSAVRAGYGKDYFTPDDGNMFLVFEFEIANNSDAELGISSLLSFSAYADDYALEYSLDAELSDDGKQLDGSIATGKKMRGIVGYEVPEDWKQAEVRFKPNVWSGQEFVFYIDREQI